MEIKCKHGMDPEWCGYCSEANEPPRRKPSNRTDDKVYQSDAIKSETVERCGGYAIISTNGRGARTQSFGHLNSTTSFIHIAGFPFLWVIQKILEKCPNLKTIQVIPPMLKGHKLETHKSLCRARGVELKAGHWWPEMAWEGENRSPYYTHQKAFLCSLTGEQKRLFDELVQFGFDEALMTARYFCLAGEDYIPQRQVAKEFGYRGEATEASTRINAVFYYLDPTFETGIDPTRRAGQFKKRIEQIHNILTEREEGNRRLREMGLDPETLPVGIPMSRLPIYQAIIEVSKNETFERLRNQRPNWHQELTLRYGIPDRQFKRLQEVGNIMGGLSRERVRQIEVEALNFLGISVDD